MKKKEFSPRRGDKYEVEYALTDRPGDSKNRILKEKQQTFNAEFQKLRNQEASFENRARVMELLGRNREVGAEMKFLESLKVGLS